MNYPGRTIKKGEKDQQIVKTIQQQLNSKGFGPLKVDGDFGSITESAIKEFQSLSRDSNNHPLVVDGKVGPISWSVLFAVAVGVPKPNFQQTALVTKVIEIAKSQVGVMEIPPGSNRGPQVEAYQKRAGASPGDPWCAAFVYWCFDEAYKAVAKSNLLPRTGSCMGHWNQTTAKKIFHRYAMNNPLLVKPGQIFIMDHGNGKGHTGIVESVADGYIKTIEGNTTINGSREGLGVSQLNRKIITINAGFIDYGEA